MSYIFQWTEVMVCHIEFYVYQYAGMSTGKFTL